ncbi:MAG: DUF1573 domain-containing protein [Bacteroidota bacterium]
MKKIIITSGFFLYGWLFASAQQSTLSPSPASPPNPNAPEITFNEISHDFGILQKGDECSYEFKFSNIGKEPLIISNCQASCGCTTPTCPKEPIAAGGTSVIKVKYDSNRIGVFSKTITITSNAKNSPGTLAIKGNIEGPPQEETFPGKNNVGIGQ